MPTSHADPVRRAVEVVTPRQAAHCKKLGISIQTLYRAILAEQDLCPSMNDDELVFRAMQRLARKD